MPEPPVGGTQEADVYSFAIIMQEILLRAAPYPNDDYTPTGNSKIVYVATKDQEPTLSFYL